MPPSVFQRTSLTPCLAALIALWDVIGNASVVACRPLHRERELARAATPAAVILAPDVPVFGHPQGTVWTGENPSDFLVWEDRNLATAAAFGLRFWTTGDRQDSEALKRLVLGCRAQMDLLAHPIVNNYIRVRPRAFVSCLGDVFIRPWPCYSIRVFT